ncbi:phage/plasmid primase, P4 family [Haematospirillum jordaniae]|uniref:phage/plasmid primase, P4 family n=1 Tax=Haematospirillum jordaniae TaxID=1549855 RepID=UPI0014333D51|nr:phage/plasmid primase, P4 family [Haematospirillum jordaniae]NKD82357.1 DNA primase [Haematospirillum jordaniae]
MTSDFQAHGQALLGNDYLVVPIKPGSKRPALDNWQTARLGIADLTGYPGHGVGVLCGQGAQPVAAIDVDTTDADLAGKFVAWCQENLGATVERIGNAPKVLLVYRADHDGWGKATGAWFEDLTGERHRLEVLGKGQQFVAYHVHPDSQRPYEWIDLFGGLDAVRASDLPIITEAQVALALQVFEDMALACGLAPVTGSRNHAGGVTSTLDSDSLMAYEPPLGINLAEAKRLLGYVDNEDYDTWLKVGMSLHHEFDGSPEALALWNEWSATARNYASGEDLEYRWSRFGKSGRSLMTARWLLKVGNQGKREVVRAEKRHALDDAKSLILACADSIDLVNEVARVAGEAAGGDLALRAELAGLIRARFKELTDTPLPVADVRAAMAGGQKVVPFPKRRHLTEFGNAERMLDHYGDGLMYVPEIDTWFIWTGIYWRRAATVELEHLAKETIRALPGEAKGIESDGERADFFKFCAVSQRAVMVRNMVSLSQSDPRVVVSVADLDRAHHLLGVGNGVVDLTNGRLLPPDPAYRVTTITSVDYDPAAPCPLFERTVADVFFGEADMIGFFQRLIGYSLMAQPTEDVLAIPYGSGSNGKSTVLGAIRDVLGDHAKMASAETFLSSGMAAGNAGQAREDVLRLRGARFVYISEPDEGSELREGLIKSMTGGEPLPARGLYSKTTVEVLPTWVAFMPTNHRPIVKGDDHAIWRRLLPVPFTRNFDQDLTLTKDPDRAEKLEAEAAGILAWCVRGALAYQRDGLRSPEQVRQARDDYKSDMDLLAEWLDECCELGPNLVESNARLWASWEAFAKGRGELRFIASAKSLGRRLGSKGFSAIRDTAGLRGKGWIGLRVIQVGDF